MLKSSLQEPFFCRTYLERYPVSPHIQNPPTSDQTLESFQWEAVLIVEVWPSRSSDHLREPVVAHLMLPEHLLRPDTDTPEALKP